FDDYTPLREVSEQRLTDEEGILFPIRDAWWYHPERTLGGGMKASQGDAFFVAPNPPFGAVFTYYLRDSLETKREQRQSAERDAKKEGEDTPYPGWDALREEEVEDPPAIVLTVRDASGMLVRRVEGQARAGFHRVAWDLRYPGTQPWSPNRGGGFFGGGGVLAPPGTYRAQLAKRVDGALTPLGDEQTFVVKPLRETVLPGMGPAEAVALHRRIAEIQRAVWGTGAALEEAMERVEAIKDVLHRSTVDDMSMRDEAVRIGERLWFLNEQLNGDSLKGNLGEPVEPTIGRWLFVASFGSALSTYGPTAHHQQNLAWAEEAFAEVRTELKQLIEKDLEALEARLEAADVPWTPGRGIPTP
ncbi:MAG: glycosyl hydrolase, partial [Acidobacteriota bacterium]